MKIEGSNPFPYSEAPAVSGAGSSTKPDFQTIELAAASDETRFSSASNAGGLLSQLKQMPDVRQQRMQALKDAIQSGKYRVSDRQIASALYAKLLAPQIH